MLRNMLHKFKGKELAQAQPPPQQSPQVSTPAAVRTKPHGLFLLGENDSFQDGSNPNGVDIVAIHGLNGDAYSTWKHENGTFWLQDLLPSALPGCRVFTFGYPSDVFCSMSMATLQDYSRGLLAALNTLSEEKQRPIIFVCHSLGGLICKQALVLAHEDSQLYGDILSAVAGILFFGTPHRGSKGADLGKTVGRVINMCLRASLIVAMSGSVRDDLFTTLGSDSRELGNLAVSSRNRLRDMAVVSFYETEIVQGLRELVVDKFSAIMEIPGEDVIPLFASHITMCRFQGATDDGYIYTLKAIQRLAKRKSLAER